MKPKSADFVTGAGVTHYKSVYSANGLSGAFELFWLMHKVGFNALKPDIFQTYCLLVTCQISKKVLLNNSLVNFSIVF